MSDPLRTTDNADDRVHGRPSLFNTGATVLLSVTLAVTSSLVAVELKNASPSALTAPPVEKFYKQHTKSFYAEYVSCDSTYSDFTYGEVTKQRVDLYEYLDYDKDGEAQGSNYCVEYIPNPSAPPTPPTPPATPGCKGLCTETCEFPKDETCDDGGSGSEYDMCDLGTDCTDCGCR